MGGLDGRMNGWMNGCENRTLHGWMWQVISKEIPISWWIGVRTWAQGPLDAKVFVSLLKFLVDDVHSWNASYVILFWTSSDLHLDADMRIYVYIYIHTYIYIYTRFYTFHYIRNVRYHILLRWKGISVSSLCRRFWAAAVCGQKKTWHGSFWGPFFFIPTCTSSFSSNNQIRKGQDPKVFRAILFGIMGTQQKNWIFGSWTFWILKILKILNPLFRWVLLYQGSVNESFMPGLQCRVGSAPAQLQDHLGAEAPGDSGHRGGVGGERIWGEVKGICCVGWGVVIFVYNFV